MIDPVQLLVKTAANYIAFKTVKSSVDYVWNRKQNTDSIYKSVECLICLQVWVGSPDECPHCKVASLRKLYRDYEYKDDNDGFHVNSNLTVKGHL